MRTTADYLSMDKQQRLRSTRAMQTGTAVHSGLRAYQVTEAEGASGRAECGAPAVLPAEERPACEPQC